MAKRYSVSKLASDAKMDPELTLISLWEEGLDYLDSTDHQLNNRDLKLARQALGIAKPRELQISQYWCRLFDISDKELKALMDELDIRMRPGAKRLPKGAIAKLKSEARRRDKPTHVLNEGIGGTKKPVKSSSLEPVVWEPIGKLRELSVISEEDVKSIHEALVPCKVID